MTTPFGTVLKITAGYISIQAFLTVLST